MRQGPRPGADRDERGAGARQRHVQQRHLRRALADQLQPGCQHAVALRPGAASQLTSTSHHARFSQHRRESRLCRFWLQLTVLVRTPTEAAQRHGQPLCSLTARPTSPRQGRAGAAVQEGRRGGGRQRGRTVKGELDLVRVRHAKGLRVRQLHRGLPAPAYAASVQHTWRWRKGRHFCAPLRC